MDTLAATYDAAVQMIDTSIVRVHHEGLQVERAAVDTFTDTLHAVAPAPSRSERARASPPQTRLRMTQSRHRICRRIEVAKTPENELLKFWCGAALQIRNRDR
jgi:hypothetical protein